MIVPASGDSFLYESGHQTNIATAMDCMLKPLVDEIDRLRRRVAALEARTPSITITDTEAPDWAEP